MLTSAQNCGGCMRRFDSPEIGYERQLLAALAIGRMAAFPESGRSNTRKTAETKVRFRPKAVGRGETWKANKKP